MCACHSGSTSSLLRRAWVGLLIPGDSVMGATRGRNSPEKQDKAPFSGCSRANPHEHKPHETPVIFAKATVCLCTRILFYQRTVDPLALPLGSWWGSGWRGPLGEGCLQEACLCFLRRLTPSKGEQTRDAIPPVHSKPPCKNTAALLQEMRLSGKVLPVTAVD